VAPLTDVEVVEGMAGVRRDRNEQPGCRLLDSWKVQDCVHYETAFDGRDAWLLFPAKLYCGQSLIDSRRESIIIDYAFTDEIAGYRENPDFLAGRRGLKVRDEIRMVRPGLYLGRAYMDHAFILNFVLYNKDVDRAGRAEFETGQIRDDCWPGTQQRIVASR